MYQFESKANAGASKTYPQQAGTILKSGYLVIKDRPCKVVAIDIFNGKKLEDIVPSSHNCDVPHVNRTDYQLIDISEDGFMVDANPKTRTYKRCKRIRWSVDIECIPEEVLFEILLRLPAQDIYFGSRLVCRNWYHITLTKNFIHKHLEHASYGLLCKDTSMGLVFISAREDGGGIIDTYKINYNYPIRQTTWSCCNGLMLEYKSVSDKIIYYVTNPLTHQVLGLPQFPYLYNFAKLSAIGYDAASMTYKVAVMCFQESGQAACLILTVGVDKSWRVVCMDHLSVHCKEMILNYPITTEGFLHWMGSNYIGMLTLNLETEIIAHVLSPIRKVFHFVDRPKWYLLSTGRYLSLFIQRGKMVWEFFVMNPGIGEWKKFSNICLEGQKGKMERLGIDYKLSDATFKPWGWLKYPEVLALRVGWDLIIFYNCITCEVSAEIFTISYFFPNVSLHKNSLVWLGGS